MDFISVYNVCVRMITGTVRERTDGHRYVTIPSDADEFETGDQVKVELIE